MPRGERKIQYEETNIRNRLRCDTNVGLSGREFKITTLNVVRGLKEKVANIQEEMSDVSREMETLGKNIRKY